MHRATGRPATPEFGLNVTHGSAFGDVLGDAQEPSGASDEGSWAPGVGEGVYVEVDDPDDLALPDGAGQNLEQGVYWMAVPGTAGEIGTLEDVARARLPAQERGLLRRGVVRVTDAAPGR